MSLVYYYLSFSWLIYFLHCNFLYMNISSLTWTHGRLSSKSHQFCFTFQLSGLVFVHDGITKITEIFEKEKKLDEIQEND
jgi:hypothetical protein